MSEYFYSHEAEIFKFYQIPKGLFEPRFRNLCTDSKVLYGMLLDRNSLSIKNGWLDEDDRVYIYFSREEAMEMLDVKKEKITKLFKELKEFNLIEEVRQGLNKPNIIYVKKFYNKPKTPDNYRKFENRTSRNPKIEPQNVRKSNGNNTYNNNTYKSKISQHLDFEQNNFLDDDFTQYYANTKKNKKEPK